jgi:hypothetical protein
MRPLAALPIAVAILASSLAGCTGTPVASGGGAQDALAGSDSCAACHEEEARLWRYGAHRVVECERCHGPGAGHARGGGGRMSLGDADLCLSCHAQGAGSSGNVVSTIESFEAHLRALERDHKIKLDRQKSGTDCVYCHDPHLLE